MAKTKHPPRPATRRPQQPGGHPVPLPTAGAVHAESAGALAVRNGRFAGISACGLKFPPPPTAFGVFALPCGRWGLYCHANNQSYWSDL